VYSWEKVLENAVAAGTFWYAFRNVPEQGAEVRLSEEAKGTRAEGPL
jgi:hypothetical protein